MKFKALFLLLSMMPACKDSCSLPTSPSSSYPGSGSNLRSEVWLTPNLASRDMLNLFSKPDQWTEARSKINVFKFYQAQLGSSCSVCGNNILPNFLSTTTGGAFRWLNKQNIKIAIEAASVKEWNCNGKMPGDNVAATIGAINAVNSSGGSVSYIAMDEPFVAGKDCGQSADVTVLQVKYYIDQVKRVFPSVQIGLIEAYPAQSVKEIEDYVVKLENSGGRVSFLHIDMHRRGALSNNDTSADLREFESFSKSHGITFGAIVWGDRGDSGMNFFNDAQLVALSIRSAVGLPSHLIFQSWSSYFSEKNYPDLRLVPDNLPETKDFTLTWIVNRVMEEFEVNKNPD